MTTTNHPMHALLTGVLAAVALLQGPAVCAADSLCPETVSVKQTALAPAPEWSLSYSTTPIQLEMVTFYNGPPKDEASLVYDAWIDAKDSSIATWKFPKGPARVLDQVLVSRHDAGAFQGAGANGVVVPRDIRSSDKVISRLAGDRANRLSVDVAVSSHFRR